MTSLVEPRYQVVQQDAVAFLRTLPAESVDLLLTDPAYASLEVHRQIGTTTRLKQSKASSNDWFQVFPNERFPEFFAEVKRVLKRDAHAYVFCDATTMFLLKPMGEAAGLRFWKPLVWDKCRLGLGYHYRARHEFVLFFEKGKRRLNDLGVPDVLAFPRVHHGYPTEKPVELAEVLIKQSTDPGALVVDPFCGSAAFGAAAARLGRHYWASDTCAEATRVARARLEACGALADARHPLELSAPASLPGLVEVDPRQMRLPWNASEPAPPRARQLSLVDGS